MPNRIIKESICTSETLGNLSWFEECLFYRLIVHCDDYGRFYADGRILKGTLFPLKSVTDKQISDAITRLSTAGILDVYEVNGRGYLQLCTWAKHQTVRAKKSKFPGPEQGIQLGKESICKQVQANVPVFENGNGNENGNDIGNGAAAQKEKAKAKPKGVYGEFENVMLTGEEHGKLVDSLGDIGAEEYIERLSAYLAQSGRRYKSHYATILTWWRKDGKPVKRRKAPVQEMKPDSVREIEAMTPEEIFGG